MSRLAKKPIELLPGVEVKVDGNFAVFKGSRGEIKLKIEPVVNVRVDDGKIWVEGKAGESEKKATVGTFWSLIKNSIQGVAEGFSKVLEIEGVGYRAQKEGRELVLFLGYAETVRVKVPEGVNVEVEKNTIKITGIDKDLVGRVAAGIRSLKKPEPYKGKGIRYQGEVIKRKVGKKAGATATT